MQNSIEKLTQQIYQEGVEKAEARAKEILDEASEKARNLVDEAKLKAAAIVAEAEKNALELKQKNEAEMRLSARQSLGALKQSITDLISWKINFDPVSEAFQDKVFVQKLIEKLISYWLENFGKEQRLRLLLPEDDYNEYLEFIEHRAKTVMSDNITIAFKGKMKEGFQIEAADLGFKVSFTAEDFENYFSAFAKPKVYKLLFEE